jgi:hypothetical protein
MRHAPLLLAIVFGGGCTPGSPQRSAPATQPAAPATQPAVGARVTLHGVAENEKVGAFLTGPNVWVDLPGEQWPPGVIGKAVEVTGTVAERHDLPVFITEPGGPPRGGIPVPPGTDLRQASRRLVLERVEWAEAEGVEP